MSEALYGGLPEYIKDSILRVKFNLGENILSYKSPLKLEFLTLIRIAVSLWQQEDVVLNINRLIDPSFNNFHFAELYRGHWPVIENQVVEKVNSLKIPKTCRDSLEEIINWIGKQILKFVFVHYHPKLSSDAQKISYFNKICWTFQGTINTLKTVEALVEFTDLSITDRYIIACNNCNEKKIRELHDRLPKKFKKSLTDEKYRLVLFWTYKIKDKLTKFKKTVEDDWLFKSSNVNNINSYIFKWAIKYENDMAVEYICKNLVDEEIKMNLTHYVKDCFGVRGSDSPDIYCFLMSQMKEDQILVLWRENILMQRVLEDWRWNEVFLTMTKYIIKFIKEFPVYDAMVILFCWNDNAFEEVQYEHFFKDTIDHFQTEIPKQNHQILFRIFSNLFSKEIELYKLFLSKITVAMKENFMSRFGLYHCTQLIQNGKLDYLNLSLKEMFETEEKVEIFRNKSLKNLEPLTSGNKKLRDKYLNPSYFYRRFYCSRFC